MTKNEKDIYNHLNINVLPPPVSGGKNDGYAELPVNTYIIRLIDRLHDHQQQLSALSSRVQELEAENRQLKDHIIHEHVVQSSARTQPSSGLERADAMTTHTLNRPLEEIGIPQHVVTLLNHQNIFKVFDLIRYTESQLSRFDGMTLSDMNTIVGCLDRVGLRLDMDIRWIDALQEYYIQKYT